MAQSKDPFGARATLETRGGSATIHRIEKLEEDGIAPVSRLRSICQVAPPSRLYSRLKVNGSPSASVAAQVTVTVDPGGSGPPFGLSSVTCGACALTVRRASSVSPCMIATAFVSATHGTYSMIEAGGIAPAPSPHEGPRSRWVS